MGAVKNNFFAGFKMKRMVMLLVLLFFLTLLFEILFNLPDWERFLAPRLLFRRFILALIVSLVVSLFYKKRIPEKTEV